MQLIKRPLLLPFAFLIVSLPVSLQAQDSSLIAPRKNIVKLNLTALVVKNISLQYERQIARKISIAASVRYMPFGKLPFVSSIKKAVDDPDVNIDQFRLGSLGVTPEIRFYLGRKGALHGFYVAPFGSFTRYKTDLPINYGNAGKTGIFSGDVKAITGGLLFGAQWKLSKSVYLDWWIIGPNYGSAKGEVNLVAALSASEQADLIDELEDLKSDKPFDKLIDEYSVNSSGASIKAKGPWAGLRGLGINIGIRF